MPTGLGVRSERRKNARMRKAEADSASLCTDTTVFDNCFDDFSTAIVECVDAAKSFVDTLLQAADIIAAVAIIAALVVALAAALTSLGVVALA
jgi:hypothetical protein